MDALSAEQQATMLAERSDIDPFVLAQSIERKIAAIAAAAIPASDSKPPARRGFRTTQLSLGPQTDAYAL